MRVAEGWHVGGSTLPRGAGPTEAVQYVLGVAGEGKFGYDGAMDMDWRHR
jgi:hypothetical protein